MRVKREGVTREEFNTACDAIWSELQYQDNLPLRTDDEAKDVPAFLTLARRYMRLTEDAWADNPGVGDPAQVPDALHGLRKIATIMVRGMAYNGSLRRE